jgi:hypothetical protein
MRLPPSFAVHPSGNSAPKNVHEELIVDTCKAGTANPKNGKKYIKKKAAGLVV